MIIQELTTAEYNPFYGKYLDLIPKDTELLSSYEQNTKDIVNFFSSIHKEKLEYRYQPEKWTIKQIFQHIIDNERIFSIRLIRVARNDKTALPGYDEQLFAGNCESNLKTIDELLEEFKITRTLTLSIVNSLNDSQLANMGTISNSDMSARACAFLNIAHSMWHMNTITERYL